MRDWRCLGTIMKNSIFDGVSMYDDNRVTDIDCIREKREEKERRMREDPWWKIPPVKYPDDKKS